jgi:hypothetical protein
MLMPWPANNSLRAQPFQDAVGKNYKLLTQMIDVMLRNLCNYVLTVHETTTNKKK